MKNSANFALIIAESPAETAEFADDTILQRFLDSTKKRPMPASGIERIYPNIWLIPLKSGLPSLVELIQEASDAKIPLRLLFLEEPPAWIKYRPPAKQSS